MTLVESILEAVASGCIIEFSNNHGVVFVEARKRVGDEVVSSSRGVGVYQLTATIGPDAVMSATVQSVSCVMLEPKP